MDTLCSIKWPSAVIPFRVQWFLLVAIILHVSPSLCKVTYDRIDEKVITTRNGKFSGLRVIIPGRRLKNVTAYLGVRYASLRGMRFMPSSPPTKSSENTNQHLIELQPVCPQPKRHEEDLRKRLPNARMEHLRNITPFIHKQQEDCFTLNLYVPQQEWNETAKMAVMVFIHGESYETGTGNAYDGSVLASFGGVIVVTLNYRLGVLGFLASERQEAQGNYAILDITQALLWLQDNIASFNGDPKRVTLFGHGYGASIVNLLLLSPFLHVDKDKPFQRAILQSGSASSTWSISYDPRWCREKMATAVNCSQHVHNTHALIECLRKQHWQDLVNSQPKAPKYYSCFAPSVVPSSFVVPKRVEDLIKDRDKSKFASVPVMFGITKNEAFSYLKQPEVDKGISDLRKTQIIRTYVQNVFRYHRQKVYEILDHHYTDWAHASDYIANRDNVLELLSDGQYVAPLVKVAGQHAETADTYLYSFTSPKQTESINDVQGIHGDELPYVFGAPLVDGIDPFPQRKHSDTDKMLSEAVMTYWTNFAKTGDPNLPKKQTSFHGGPKSPNRFVGMKWPRYTTDKQEYLYIGRRPAVKDHYRAQKLALWLDLIPKINKDDGSKPSSHLLADSDNISTFDDYNRLISTMHTIFPTPPSMPPPRPTPRNVLREPKDRSHLQEVLSDTEISWNPHDDDNTDDSSSAKTSAIKEGSGHVNDGPEHVTEATAGIPLSIVVAIGSTLLLINLLIFAALCYQRERIRKERLITRPIPSFVAAPDIDDAARLQRKYESSKSLPCAGATGCTGSRECVSLLSASSTLPRQGHHQQGGVAGNSNIHSPSPQPSNHSKRGGSVPRTSPLPDNVQCNYEPVPTQTSSPVHRPVPADRLVDPEVSGRPVSPGVVERPVAPGPANTRTYANSNIKPLPSDNIQRPIDGRGPTAFRGVGFGNQSGAYGERDLPYADRGVPRGKPIETPRVPKAAPEYESGNLAEQPRNLNQHQGGKKPEDPVYKTINKSGQKNTVSNV